MSMKAKYTTTSEAFDILSKEKEHNDFEKENLSYTEAFLKYKGKDARKAVNYLMSEFKLQEKVAVKLVDLKPGTKEQLTVILSTYGVMLSEEDLNKVEDYFND